MRHREGPATADSRDVRQWRVRLWIRGALVLVWLGLALERWDVVRQVHAAQMSPSEQRDGYVALAVLALLIYLFAFRPRLLVGPDNLVTVRNPVTVRQFSTTAVAGVRMSAFGLVFELTDGRRRHSILFQDTLALSEPRWFDVAEAVTGERPAQDSGVRGLAGSGLEEFLIVGNDLLPEQRDGISRAVLCAMHEFAVRFEIDIPDPGPDAPANARTAADVLRHAADRLSEKDGGHATSGWLDPADPDVWQAFLSLAPWSYDGSVLDAEGHQIVGLADGYVISVAVTPEQRARLVAAVGPERLLPWLQVKAERRATRRRWMRRHPDVLVGWFAVGLGLLLVPLPGPGFPVVTAGAVLLIAGAAVRRAT